MHHKNLKQDRGFSPGSSCGVLMDGERKTRASSAPPSAACEESAMEIRCGSKETRVRERREAGDEKTGVRERREAGDEKTEVCERREAGDEKTGVHERREAGDEKTEVFERREAGDEKTGVHERREAGGEGPPYARGCCQSSGSEVSSLV